MALYFDLGNDYTKLEKELLEKNRILNERLESQTLINETLAKQLTLYGVSNRRELLTAFLRYGKQRHYTPLTEEQIEALVNDFEGSL